MIKSNGQSVFQVLITTFLLLDWLDEVSLKESLKTCKKQKNNVLLTCRELTGFHGLEKSEEYSVMPSYDHKIKK